MDATASPRALEGLDDQALRAPVRAALGDSSAFVVSWSSRSIYNAVAASTGGVYRVNGQARAAAGLVEWSVVLKVIRCPADQVAWAAPQELSRRMYWRREPLAYASGLLRDLPAGLRAPVCYGVVDRPDATWLWLEDVREAGPTEWPLSRYAFAAWQLGMLNGVYLAGKPLPQHSWLNRNHMRERLATHAGSTAQLERVRPESQVSDDLRAALRLQAESETFLGALDRLPHTLRHNDADRRNLFATHAPDGSDETVAIDWSYLGIGPIGEDLAPLVGTSVLWRCIDSAHLPELERACLDAYTSGLAEAGYAADPTAVRLGYAATFALRYALSAFELTPPAGRASLERLIHRPFDDIAAHAAVLRRFALERAKQARRLLTH